MAPALDVDVIRTSVLPTVSTLVSDRIPNIRFNVAKALEVLATSLASNNNTGSGGRQLVADQIVPALDKLREDSDADVRFFAEKGLQTAQAAAGLQGYPQHGAAAESQEVTMSDA